eukprot:NODE_222_length_13951_cov_0.396982.p11 type:complete len:126 gc:universal NODE_222_length_13951_cov_0.396982:6980-6603(-)
MFFSIKVLRLSPLLSIDGIQTWFLLCVLLMVWTLGLTSFGALFGFVLFLKEVDGGPEFAGPGMYSLSKLYSSIGSTEGVRYVDEETELLLIWDECIFKLIGLIKDSKLLLDAADVVDVGDNKDWW